MNSRVTIFLLAATVVFAGGILAATAAEPNQDFAASTFLGPGIFSVSDQLFGEIAVFDTTLGAFDQSGTLLSTDDDSSPLGNGFASALFDQPVNADGSIELAVSGFFDFDFDGLNDGEVTPHGQAGPYELLVTVLDDMSTEIDSFAVLGDLASGGVDAYSFSDPSWTGGFFSAAINNSGLGDPGDIDFFTFTGLIAGGSYVAEIVEGYTIDPILGWFDDTGALITVDDDGGEGLLSRLEATASLAGEITLAVSGFSDFDFLGAHPQDGDYRLTLTLIPEPISLSLLLFSGLTLAFRLPHRH